MKISKTSTDIGTLNEGLTKILLPFMISLDNLIKNWSKKPRTQSAKKLKSKAMNQNFSKINNIKDIIISLPSIIQILFTKHKILPVFPTNKEAISLSPSLSFTLQALSKEFNKEINQVNLRDKKSKI